MYPTGSEIIEAVVKSDWQGRGYGFAKEDLHFDQTEHYLQSGQWRLSNSLRGNLGSDLHQSLATADEQLVQAEDPPEESMPVTGKLLMHRNV